MKVLILETNKIEEFTLMSFGLNIVPSFLYSNGIIGSSGDRYKEGSIWWDSREKIYTCTKSTYDHYCKILKEQQKLFDRVDGLARDTLEYSLESTLQTVRLFQEKEHLPERAAIGVQILDSIYGKELFTHSEREVIQLFVNKNKECKE